LPVPARHALRRAVLLARLRRTTPFLAQPDARQCVRRTCRHRIEDVDARQTVVRVGSRQEAMRLLVLVALALAVAFDAGRAAAGVPVQSTTDTLFNPPPPISGPAPQWVEFGPASSPVLFKPRGALPPKMARKASAAAKHILGLSITPISSRRGVFIDQRPYGEPSEQDVVLIRFELRNVTRGGVHVTDALSLAVNAAAGTLVCAFTDVIPTRVKSETTSDNIVAAEQAEYDFAPARYDSLRSTVVDALFG